MKNPIKAMKDKVVKELSRSGSHHSSSHGGSHHLGSHGRAPSRDISMRSATPSERSMHASGDTELVSSGSFSYMEDQNAYMFTGATPSFTHTQEEVEEEEGVEVNMEVVQETDEGEEEDEEEEEEDEEEEESSGEYEAPQPRTLDPESGLYFTPTELAIYNELKDRPFEQTKVYDPALLHDIGMDVEFHSVFSTIGWSGFHDIAKEKGSKELTLDFLSTLKTTDDNISFRMLNHDITLSWSEFSVALGFAYECDILNKA